jgi:hypothetical protein
MAIRLGGCDLVLDDPFVVEGQAYIVGGILGAVVCAKIDYAGRDWRRIKREMNKAAREYRRENPESVERWRWNG